MHQVRLIAVSCFESNLGEAFSGVPHVADKMQAGETAQHLGRHSNCGAEMAFKSALTHRHMACNRSDGRAATGSSDRPDSRLDLIGDSTEWAQAVCEEARHSKDLLPHFACVGKGVLNLFDLPGWNQGIERKGLVVQKVDTIVEDR